MFIRKFVAAVVVIGCAFAFATTAVAKSKRLVLDARHSHIEFVAFTHLFEVEGTFDDYEIHVDGDLEKPSQAKVHVKVLASSVTTHFDAQDSALRSKDFLDARSHPWITYRANKVTQGDGKLTLHGKLTIRDQTKPVQVTLRTSEGADIHGRKTRSYRGRITIRRSDFQIGNDKMMNELALQDEIELHLMIVVPLTGQTKPN